jgi:hypothetical protein
MFSELGFEGKGRLNPADEFREKMSSLRSMVQKRKEMERVLASSDIDTGIMKALKIVDDLTTTPEVPEIMPSVARTYSQGDMWEGVVSIMETGMESPAGKRMTDIFQKLDDIIRGLDAGDTKAVLSEIDNLRTYLKTDLAGDLTQSDAQTKEAIYTILVDFPVDDPVSELIMEIYDNVLNQNPKAARNALNNLEQHLSKPKITQVIEGMTPEDAATLAAMQQTGAPEAGLQAGFGGEEVLTFDTLKPHVPKSKGKATQINMDDFMKLQEVYKKQGKQPGMSGYAVKPEIEGIRGMEDPKAPVLKLELQTPGLKTKSQRIIELNNMKKEIKLLMEGRKTEYWEARAKHASEMAKIREPAIGEGYLFEPMFAGKIYTQEFKDAVNVWFGRNPGSKVLSFVSDTAGILRLKAGMDFSYMMLQGLPSFGLAHAYLLCNPRIGVQMIGRWYKALGYSVLSAISPDNFYKYINKNIDGVYQRIAMGGSSATLDYFNILHSSGSLSGMVNKLLDNIPLKPMERADLAWLSGGEYVRNTFWDLLKDDAIKSGNERQLAVFLDRMTGIIDTTSMGVPRTVQQLESSFIWFAPRYTRACLSLLSGIFRGGYTGTMARKAIGGMLGAGVMYYVGTQYAIASLNGLSAEDAWKSIEEGFGITEDPITGEISWKPSSRMMTIKVGNYYFGIGSFWYGLVRLAGNINDAIGMQISNKGITLDPDTDRIDMVRILKGGTINRDNPFVQWWYSRSSPW